MKKMALIYDFDKTLSIKNMQEYTLFDELDITPDKFWSKSHDFANECKMDNVLTYMYLLLEMYKEKKLPLTRNTLKKHGAEIQFFEGVETWFSRIKEYGRERNIEIEHYIISSGLKEVIDGSKISKEFKSIFASEFHYNEDSVADWPLLVINYTGKTQYLFRINKNVLDINDDDNLNSYMPKKDRAIPFSNMIYIGDGYTDVPCMKLVKEYGGHSIAVTSSDKTEDIAEKLKKAKRVEYVCGADYRNNSQLDLTVKSIIEYIARKSI